MLWKNWWEWGCELRSACARTRTFLWMAICPAGMTIRKDLMGVTSIVRAPGLVPVCYDRLLDFFHRPAWDLSKLARLWCKLVCRVHPGILRVNGRPVLIGDGIKVASLRKNPEQIQETAGPRYGEAGVTIRFRTADLLWRPVGNGVRFMAVDHPRRGTILLMSTDLNLTPVDIIRIYGLRFKIEVSFKQSLRVVGAYAYHFWMAAIKPLRRVSGNQHLHRESNGSRHAVRRKIGAYHRHIQLGLIAQGLLQILSPTMPKSVWRSFGSWIRTTGSGRFARARPPPNRLSPSRCDRHSRNLSQVPQKP